MNILSILIPTLKEREESFRRIRDHIIQTTPPEQLQFIEILSDDRDPRTTTGEKRNDLLKRASGKYVWFIDDDDMITLYAMEEVLKGCATDADVICYNGYMTTNGTNRVDWEIRLGHPYQAVQRDGKEYYLRHPNHISPMKRELALLGYFPHTTNGEDYNFACQLLNKDALKTEYIIDRIIYHYDYNPIK